jgi:cytidylate kinase
LIGETYRIAFKNLEITCDDVFLAAFGWLIDHWLLKADVSVLRRYDQIAFAINSETSLSLEAHLNLTRVSSWRHPEIELQASFVAVINQVRSWINTCITQAFKGWQPGMPLFTIISDEVIHRSW